MSKKSRFYSILILGLLVISSCTMEPKYQRPSLPIPEQFNKDEISKQENISNIEWQKFFTSENLQKIIQTALDNNRDLRIATLNVDAARALYRINLANLMPNVDASSSVSKQKPSENSSLSGSTKVISNFNANLNMAYEIDLFGKIRSLNKSALKKFLATKEARNAAQITLISEVANAYFQFLADQKILQLSNEVVVAQEKYFSLIEKRFNYGIASKLDLLQAQTIVENAKANQASYQTKVTQDKNALLLLMGIKDSALLEATEDLDNIKLLENLPANLSSEILLLRPDVMQAEYELKAANANIGAARAAFFPSISLTGSFGYASNDLSNLFSNGSYGAWNFVPKINLPIFEGGKNKANLDYATISKNIAVAKYEKSIQTAFGEVANQLESRKNLGNQIKAINNLVNATESSYKISKTRYEEGIDNFSIVLQSQIMLFEAKQNKIELQKQQLSNLTQLYKAIGGGALIKLF